MDGISPCFLHHTARLSRRVGILQAPSQTEAPEGSLRSSPLQLDVIENRRKGSEVLVVKYANNMSESKRAALEVQRKPYMTFSLTTSVMCMF